MSEVVSSESSGSSGPAFSTVLSVSELLERAERRVETVATGYWIAGEVSEAKKAASGHRYFTLRDAGGQIRCVLFAGVLRSAAAADGAEGDFAPGDKLEVAGALMVYPRSGDLQLRVLRWRRAGLGTLYEAFLALRAKLEAEGLFSPARKKTLPAFVRHVCVLTSSKGAAIQDVLTTLKRRTPWVRITFANVLVQGKDAPASVMRGLAAADSCGADLLLLVRGGGSFEDLNAFNDESLARTIASLRTPIVVGVGHETDTTIAELVADRRASTPTAAAEAVGPALGEWRARLDRSENVLTTRVMREGRLAAERLDRAAFALGAPEALFRRQRERLERAARLLITPEEILRRRAEHLAEVEARLTAAYRRTLTDCARTAHEAAVRLDGALAQRLALLSQRLTDREAVLAAHNPDLPLKKGYVAIRNAKRTVLTRLTDLCEGESVTLSFADGEADARITNLRPGREEGPSAAMPSDER